MNERILKLFMQACRHANYEHQNVPKELVEKFSELIVRECAEFTHPVTRKFIFEHFGVEE